MGLLERIGSPASCRSSAASLRAFFFFFTAAIVGGRFEHCEPHIDPDHQRMLWYLPTIALGLIWFVCTAASSNGVSYDAVTDLWSLFLVVLGAFVPWVITGYVVCGNGVYSIGS